MIKNKEILFTDEKNSCISPIYILGQVTSGLSRLGLDESHNGEYLTSHLILGLSGGPKTLEILELLKNKKLTTKHSNAISCY